jgi:hypothetical protein
MRHTGRVRGVGKPTFQTFQRYKVTAEDTPIVNVTLRGLFSMNQESFEALKEPDYVELLYSPDGYIGFKAAPRESPNAYRLRHHSKTAYQVEGRAFLRLNGIPDGVKGRRYHAEVDDDGILVVDLSQDSERTSDTTKQEAAGK